MQFFLNVGGPIGICEKLRHDYPYRHTGPVSVHTMTDISPIMILCNMGKAFLQGLCSGFPEMRVVLCALGFSINTAHPMCSYSVG